MTQVRKVEHLPNQEQSFDAPGLEKQTARQQSRAISMTLVGKTDPPNLKKDCLMALQVWTMKLPALEKAALRRLRPGTVRHNLFEGMEQALVSP